MTLAALVALVTIAFIISAAYAHLRARGLTNSTWDDLLMKMQPVSPEGISAIALERYSPTTNQPELDQEEIWRLVGGLAGLQRMRNNADVMIALAAYAERSNNHERMIIAERMRHDGLVIRRAVRSIRIARSLHIGRELLANHLRDAAESYDKMRQRLPALYELSRGGQRLAFG